MPTHKYFSQKGELLFDVKGKGYDHALVNVEPNGSLWYCVIKDKKQGACDYKGNEIVAPVYQMLTYNCDAETFKNHKNQEVKKKHLPNETEDRIAEEKAKKAAAEKARMAAAENARREAAQQAERQRQIQQQRTVVQNTTVYREQPRSVGTLDKIIGVFNATGEMLNNISAITSGYNANAGVMPYTGGNFSPSMSGTMYPPIYDMYGMINNYCPPANDFIPSGEDMLNAALNGVGSGNIVWPREDQSGRQQVDRTQHREKERIDNTKVTCPECRGTGISELNTSEKVSFTGLPDKTDRCDICDRHYGRTQQGWYYPHTHKSCSKCHGTGQVKQSQL